MARLRRWLGRLLLALFALAGLGYAMLQTPWGQQGLGRVVELALSGVLGEGYTVAFPRVALDARFRLVAQDVAFRAPDGKVIIGVRRLDLDLDPTSLVWLRVKASSLRVDGVRVDMEIDDEGVLDIVRLFGGPSTEPVDPDAEPFQGLPFDIVVPDVGLRNGLVSLWGPPDADGDRAGFSATVLELTGGAMLPRWTPPEVRVSEPRLRAVLTQPGPGGVTLDAGQVVWTGDGVLSDDATLAVLGNAFGLDGQLRGISGASEVDVDLDVRSLDLAALDAILGIPLAGSYAGALQARGSLGSLALTGALAGTGATRGALAFREGTVVCLPRPVETEDGCGVSGTPSPVPPFAPLRWNVDLGIDDLALEQIVPSLGGPLVLNGDVRGRGGGTRWPDEVAVERLTWTGRGLDVFGVRLREVDLDVSLRDGVLRARKVAARAVVGRARGTARLDLVEGDLSADVQGTLEPALLRDVGVTQLGGAGTFQASLRGDVLAPGAPLEIQGSLQAAPLSWEGDAAVVDRAEASFAVRVQDGEVEVEASAAVDGVAAYGATAPHVEIPNVRVTVDPELVAVGIDATAPRADYGTLVRAEALDTRVDVTVPTGGDVQVAVEAAVGPHDLYGFPGTEGNVEVRLEGDDLRVDADLRKEGGTLVSVTDFRLDLATMTMDVAALVAEPTWRQRWTLDRPAHLRLLDDGVADADVALVSNFGEIEVQGTLVRSGQLGAQVWVRSLDLDALAELFPDQMAGLDGLVTAELVASGPTTRPAVVLDLDASSIFVEGAVRWLDAKGTVRVQDDRLSADVAVDVAGKPLARVEGYAPVRSDLADPGLVAEGDADLAVVLRAGALGRFVTLVPNLELPEGEASGTLRVTGDLHDPDLDLQAVVRAALPDLSEPLRAEVDVARRAGMLRTHVDAYLALDRILRVDGTARTRLGEVMDWLLAGAPQPDFADARVIADDARIDARLEEAPVGRLLDVLGIDIDLDGTLDGRVAMVGSPLTPELDVDLHGDLVVAGQASTLDVVLAPATRGYDVDLALGDPYQVWLSVAGALPVAIDLRTSPTTWGTGDLDLSFAGPGLPLEVLSVIDPGFEGSSGAVALAGTLRGTIDQPQPAAQVRLDEVYLQYVPLGVAIPKLTATIDVVPDEADVSGSLRLVLSELQAGSRPITAAIDRLPVANAGLWGSGEVALRDWRPTDLQGSFTLRDVWLISRDSTALRVTGKLLAGGTWPELDINGNLKVDQGKFALDTAELSTSRTTRLDQAIVVHRGQGAGRSVQEPPPSPFLQGLDLDVDVSLGRNTSVALKVPLFEELGSFGADLTRAAIDARVGGAVSVGMKGADLSLVGDVEVIEGRVKVLRGDFAISSDSRITFLGADYADPLLEVGGRMGLPSGDVSLRLSGRASDPSFDFDSDFGDDAAVLTILLTGQAPDELSSDQGQAALQAVGDLLLSSVLGDASLGSVSVEADGTVTLGIPVYRTVYVESSFDPTPELRENSVIVRAEWNILPRLLLAAAYGDREILGDLIYELRLTTLCDPARHRFEDAFDVDTTQDLACWKVRQALRAWRRDGEDAELPEDVPAPPAGPDEAKPADEAEVQGTDETEVAPPDDGGTPEDAPSGETTPPEGEADDGDEAGEGPTARR